MMSCICGTGDFIRQRAEMMNNPNQKYSLSNTGKMMLFGCFSGAMQHYWYTYLDRAIIKGTIHRIVGKKIFADQLIFSPFFICVFFTGVGLIEGHSLKECKEEIEEKALEVFIVDCSVWPAAQAINFYFLPNHLRLAYVNFVTLCWNVFLSYTKHKGQKKD